MTRAPLLALLLLLTGAPAVAADRYQSCLDQARQHPAEAVTAATAWRMAGGGAAARHCLGMAYLAQDKFAQAALAFEQAAQAAAGEHGVAASDLWAQAGNAQLLAGDAGQADADLNAALAAAAGRPRPQGEILIDRARAAVELGKPQQARDDLDSAVKLAPADPEGWLLRATLARRDGRYDDAAASIATALKLAPADSDVLLEAGNIAGLSGDTDMARSRWAAAVKAAPASAAGKAAAQALAANAAP